MKSKTHKHKVDIYAESSEAAELAAKVLHPRRTVLDVGLKTEERSTGRVFH